MTFPALRCKCVQSAKPSHARSAYHFCLKAKISRLACKAYSPALRCKCVQSAKPLTHEGIFTAKAQPNFRYRLMATKRVLNCVLRKFIARQTKSPTFVIVRALRLIKTLPCIKAQPNFRYRLMATKRALYCVLRKFIARQTKSPTFVIVRALRQPNEVRLKFRVMILPEAKVMRCFASL